MNPPRSYAKRKTKESSPVMKNLFMALIIITLLRRQELILNNLKSNPIERLSSNQLQMVFQLHPPQISAVAAVPLINRLSILHKLNQINSKPLQRY